MPGFPWRERSTNIKHPGKIAASCTCVVRVWCSAEALTRNNNHFSDLGGYCFAGGEGGIRTLGTHKGTTVFETAPIDRSGTSPTRQRRRQPSTGYPPPTQALQ